MPNTTIFTFPIRVYIEDTDAGGIVYHANHIKFMERARSEWLRVLGIRFDLLKTEYMFVVHGLEIKYFKPARFNDLLEVSVVPLQLKQASFTVLQEIYCDTVLVAKATVSIACVSNDLKPIAIPADIRKIINTHYFTTPDW